VDIVAGGYVDGITYHPTAKDLVYARTDIGGAYRWNPQSSRWVPLLDWLTKPNWNLYGIESLAIDPSNSNRLYLACGTYTNQWGDDGAILRSEDQGRTFQRANLPFKLGGNENGRSAGERLAVDPQDGAVIYFGTRNDGLWKSSDQARTWSQVASFPVKSRTNGIGVTSVAFDPRSHGKSIYVGVASLSQNLFHSDDSGETWSFVSSAPQGDFVHHLVIANSGRIYETLSSSSGPNDIANGAVFTMDPATGEWKDISPVHPHENGEGGFGYAGLSIDPRNDSRLVVSTLDRWKPGDDVFVSSDMGAHWQGLQEKSRMDASAAPYMNWGVAKPRFGWWIGAVAMDPFQHDRVLYGTGANIWGCDDVEPGRSSGMIRWTVRGNGIEETADIDLLSPPNGPHLISALGDIGGFTHVNLDKPAPGMSLNPLLNNTDCLASSKDGSVIAKVGRPENGQAPGGVSRDYGLTWHPFTTTPSRRSAGGSVAISSDGKRIVWATAGRCNLTMDDGRTWIPSNTAARVSQVLADPADPKLFFGIGLSQKVCISRDGGENFQLAPSTGIPHQFGEMRTCYLEPNTLYLPSDSGLFRSKDGGQSFLPFAGVDSADSVGFGKPAPHSSFPTIFLNGKVAGEFGVFKSIDDGKTWALLTDPQHEYGTRGVVIGDPRIYGRFYLGTNGRGVLYADSP
jgi:hypothetical protein